MSGSRYATVIAVFYSSPNSSRLGLFVFMINYTSEQLKNIRIYRCNSKASGANSRFDDKITAGDVVLMLERNNYKCLYCHSDIIPDKWHLDHFYSKLQGGKNIVTNIAPACKLCNLMKTYMDGFSFIKRCHRIASLNRDLDDPTPKLKNYDSWKPSINL